MKILILWELVPEDTEAYIVNVTDTDTLEKLKRCHGQYINGNDMDEGLSDWLSKWMQTIKSEKITLSPGSDPVSIADCELMILTGFIL